MSVVLACDLGGSSFRAALVDDNGDVRAEASVAAPVAIERAGASDIDAGAWWQCLLHTATELSQASPELFAQVQAIAICGVTRTQIFLDGDGQPLRPAMTWKDTRSDATAQRLVREIGGTHPELAKVNAFHPLARLAWVKQEEQAHFSALACVLEPKDFLNFRLTGQRAGDPISIARLLASAPSVGGADLLSAIGLSSAILPPVLEPCDRVGGVLAGLPSPFDGLAGVPVFCCSNDTWAAALGLGALRPGYAYNISGTTEVLGVMVDTAVEAEGLLTVDWRGLYQLGGPSQNGADTVTWLLSLLGRTDDQDGAVADSVNELLAGARHPQPLLFLPYLQGERVPYWDPALRGAFIGLGRQHGATDLAFAVLEGVAFLNRVVLERAEAATGQAVTEIRFGGGAASNPVWCQIKADICDRPVVVGTAREPGTLGAAIVAWTGLGRYASLAQAQDKLVGTATRYEPDPARKVAYDAQYRLYRDAEQALAPISRGLSALTHPARAAAPHQSKGA